MDGSRTASLLLVSLFAGLAACTPKKDAGASGKSTDYEERKRLEKEAEVQLFRDYAKACTEALGEIPAVSCVPNGTDAIELVSLGKPEFSPSDATPESAGLYMDRGHGCVNPAWISGGSRSFSCASKQVLSRKSRQNARGEQVDWVALCREPKRDDASKGFEVARFTQVGVIGYNQTTGDTCFFNVGPKGTKSGSKSFPSPSDPQATEVFDSVRFVNWMEACTTCHTLGPWVRSPLVSPEILHEKLASTDLVSKLEGDVQKQFFSKPPPLHPDGRPFVPSNFRLEGKRLVPGPYRIVFQKELKEAASAARKEHVWSPRVFPKGTSTYCESCHAIPLESEGIVSLMLSKSSIRGGQPAISEFAEKPPAPFESWHDVLASRLNAKKAEEAADTLSKTWSDLRYE